MNKVQELAHKVLQSQEESVRFSVTLTKTDSSRLERIAELMGRSKSAFCSELIVAALDDMQEVIDTPDANIDISLPTTQQYVAAFNAIKHNFTDGHRAMLMTHCDRPEQTTTASELARSAGYKHFGGANLQYARIGRMLADYLTWSLPEHSDGSPFPTALLVKWSFDDVWYCQLHPQVTEALKITGLAEA
jgi:predicted DNA-binding protein